MSVFSSSIFFVPVQQELACQVANLHRNLFPIIYNVLQVVDSQLIHSWSGIHAWSSLEVANKMAPTPRILQHQEYTSVTLELGWCWPGCWRVVQPESSVGSRISLQFWHYTNTLRLDLTHCIDAGGVSPPTRCKTKPCNIHLSITYKLLSRQQLNSHTM